MFSKIKKYVIGFFVLLGGALIAFLSGKSASQSKEKRKDIDKKIKIVRDALKSNKIQKKDVQKLLKDKKKELEKIKKPKPKKKPKKKSAKKAHSKLKKIGKGKKGKK